MSQVRNYMKMKAFQLSEVRNKSELIQKYIHTTQMNLQFIVTLAEGTYLWLLALKQSCMNENNNLDTIENCNIYLPIYRG